MEQKKKRLKLVKEEEGGNTLDYVPGQIKDLSKKKTHFKGEREEKSNWFIPHQDFQLLNKVGVNRKEFEAEINRQVEEKLSQLQKASEEKGYQIGLKMGESKALETHSEKIEKSIKSLNSLVQSLQEKETQVVLENKEQILKVTFEVAKKMAMKEISENKESILRVIEKVFDQLDSDSTIVIYLSEEDKNFIESVQSDIGNEIKTGSFKKVILKSSSKVQSGGCIVETSYAQIDASLKARLDEIWNTLYESLLREKEEKLGKD